MVTEIALVGDALVVVKCDSIVGAGVNTGPASGAQIIIHDDNAVIALVDRLLRADIGTGGIIAVTAQVHLEDKFRFVIYQPGAILRNIY